MFGHMFNNFDSIIISHVASFTYQKLLKKFKFAVINCMSFPFKTSQSNLKKQLLVADTIMRKYFVTCIKMFHLN